MCRPVWRSCCTSNPARVQSSTTFSQTKLNKKAHIDRKANHQGIRVGEMASSGGGGRGGVETHMRRRTRGEHVFFGFYSPFDAGGHPAIASHAPEQHCATGALCTLTNIEGAHNIEKRPLQQSCTRRTSHTPTFTFHTCSFWVLDDMSEEQGSENAGVCRKSM